MFIISYPCKVRHAVSNEKKPIPSLTNRMMRAMVLLDLVVKILALPQFTRIWHHPLRFQLLESFRIGGVFIHGDDSRSAAMWRSKRFREEAFSRFRIALGAQEKFQGVTLRVHSAIEVHPDLFHFDVRLIDAPRVVCRCKVEPTALLQLWCVVLHESGRSWCDRHRNPLEHHLLLISVAKWITEVPPDAEQNDISLEVTLFEWGGGIHEIGSSRFSEYRRVYCIYAIFATQPLILNKKQLHRVLHGKFFNRARPHQGIQQQDLAAEISCVPLGRRNELVIAAPLLDGFHHDYKLVACALEQGSRGAGWECVPNLALFLACQRYILFMLSLPKERVGRNS